jgi:Protein of unknown function (DUF3105)
MAKRYAQKQDRKAKIEAMRAQQRARERRRRLIWFGGGGIVAVAAIVAIVLAVTSSPGAPGVTTSAEVMPPAVTGQTTAEAPAATVANTTGISGVVAYDTNGYPGKAGPANQALPHDHVTGPVRYSVTPPVGGHHNAEWMNCGVYDKPVPSERAVHNLEHGAVWITYQPSLPQSQVSQLRSFFARQTKLNPGGQGASRYVDLTPFPGLPSPVVISSWGFQLRLTSPADPRLQQFVDKFRASQTYTPEYGSPCTGGLGTPLQQ